MPQESNSDALLSAIVRCSEILLGSVDIDAGIRAILPALGEAANLSRIKVFLRVTPGDGLRLAYEWWEEGLTSQTDLGFTHFSEKDLQEIEHMWRDQGYYWGYVEAWPEPLLSAFRQIGVLSVGVVSLMAGRRYAGCIAFDCCTERRKWSRSEINALTAASQAVGAAMRREEVEREHKELYASEREEASRRSAADQLQAALSERERIAAELHDGLQQVMIALSLQAQTTNRLLAAVPGAEHVQSNLEEIACTAHLGLAELRGAVVKVGSPASISVLELELKLREVCSTLHTGRLRCHFELIGSGSMENFDCTPLFRIAQEAVTNAWKHSGGSSLEVKLQHELGGLHLSIVDDGVGFDVDAVPSGRGLKSIVERANHCGALLDVRQRRNTCARLKSRALELSK